MAKQLGNYITGTFDEICFYKMEGHYYVRMKSSLQGKRVKRCAAFKNTMQSAKQLAAASVIASTVYRKIPKEERKVEWFRKMTGMAKVLLKKGTGKETIVRKLTDYVAAVLPAVMDNKKKDRKLTHTIRSFIQTPFYYKAEKRYKCRQRCRWPRKQCCSDDCARQFSKFSQSDLLQDKRLNLYRQNNHFF